MDSEKSNQTIEQVSERTTGDALLDTIQLENARQDAEDRVRELRQAFIRGEIEPQDYHNQSALLIEGNIASIDRKLKALTGEVNTPEGETPKQQRKLGSFVAKLLRRG